MVSTWSILMNEIHILAFSLQFGVNIWFPFMQGAYLRYNKPAHEAARIQGELFHLYFSVNTVCIIIQLIVPHHAQYMLVVSLICALCNQSMIGPQLIQLTALVYHDENTTGNTTSSSVDTLTASSSSSSKQ